MAATALTEAQERKLRTIYEALDNANNKKAVQLADKLLKKQKDFTSVRALKGLGLYRLGRHDDAAAVIASVQVVAEDSTIQALTLYYRESRRHGDMCTLYESLVKLVPGHEEFLAQLFMACVRVSNFKKQQQVAFSLHKHFPTKNPYCFWGAMSVFLQAHFGDAKMAEAILLPLSERMVEKLVKEEKVEAEAEVRLYLMILLRQKKLTKALEVIRSPLGDMFHGRDEQLSYELQILADLKEWHELVPLYRTELQRNPENWSFWKGYMDALSQVLSSSSDNAAAAGEVDSDEALAVSGLHRFLVDLEESLTVAEKQPQKSRNIQLAKVELRKRLLTDTVMAANGKDLAIGSMYEQVLEYVAAFGGKPTCFNDMRPYVELLSAEEKAKLADHIAEQADASTAASKDSGSAKDQISAVTEQCLAVQMSRFAGQHGAMSVPEKNALVDKLMQHHADGLPLGKDLRSTDIQYVDTLPLVAAHLLVDMDQELGGQEEYLFRAIVSLEHAASVSPSASQIKLCLIKLYCRYGAFDPCAIIFNELQIKHILLESIGYLWSTPVFGLAYFRTASVMAGMLLGLSHDASEFLITAYRSGTFHKIIEITEFHTKLEKSLQLATAGTLYQAVELLTKSSTIEDVVLRYQQTSPIVFPRGVAAQFQDLRDVRAMRDWSPPALQFSDLQQQLSFQLETLWVEIRSSVIRSVCCVCSAAATFSVATTTPATAAASASAAGNSVESKMDDLDLTGTARLGSEELASKARAMDSGGLAEAAQLVDSIEELCREASQHQALRERYPLAGPHQTGLASYLDGCHGSIHTAALIIAITTHNLLRPQESCSASQAESLDGIRKSVDAMCSALQDSYARARASVVTGDGETRRFVGGNLEQLVNVAESLSNITFLLSCANYFVNCSRGSSKKARKKKTSGVVSEILDLLTGAHTRVSDILSDVRTYVSGLCMELHAKTLPSVLPSVVEQMPERYANATSRALGRIQDSHYQAMESLSEVLEMKRSALAAVKL